MTSPTLPKQPRDAGLSAWELGNLLGIHPRLVSGSYPPLLDRPVQVLIEIARRLNIHPADLVPELDLALAGRQVPGDADGGRGRRADAITVLAAPPSPAAPAAG
jgi:hypothetical protein